MEAKINLKKALEDEKDEKVKLIRTLQNKLNETQNLFESFTNSLARIIFEKEFKSKYENFMALQKVYGAKVHILINIVINCLHLKINLYLNIKYIIIKLLI